MLVFTIAVIFILVIRLVKTGDFIGNASFIALVMILAGFVFRSYAVPYLHARKLWKNPAIQRVHTGIINLQGIVYHLKEGEKTIPWSRFSRMRKTKGFVSLVTLDGLLVVFPREFFKTDSDWHKFIDILDNHVLVINR